MPPFLQMENGGNRIDEIGTFMVVQWLRLHANDVGGLGYILRQGTEPACHN